MKAGQSNITVDRGLSSGQFGWRASWLIRHVIAWHVSYHGWQLVSSWTGDVFLFEEVPSSRAKPFD